MASSSKIVPPHPDYESDRSSDDVSSPNEHRTAKPKEIQTARPTITAMRIPADGTPPHMITLPLVKATSDYHFNLHDSTLLHHSNADDMRAHHRHSIQILNPTANDTQIDLNLLYDSIESLEEKAMWSLEELEDHPGLFANSYGNSNDRLRDIPRAEKTETPHLTFTHASLRLQPDVVDPFWKSNSGDVWNRRAFKRLYAILPYPKVDLEKMAGEYHIMYTLAVGKGLRLNTHSRLRIFGDAFVLKMASGNNEEGDWYYENVLPEILHCSLKNQCLETLRCLRPTRWHNMVGERANGMPGLSKWGTGLKDMFTPVYDN